MGECVPPVPTTARREWKRADHRVSGPECTPAFACVSRMLIIIPASCEQSSLLRGLSPDDAVSESGGGSAKVRERLAGYIGNLEAVQAANSQGRTVAADVPVREFSIESWRVEDDEGVIAYGLA